MTMASKIAKRESAMHRAIRDAIIARVGGDGYKGPVVDLSLALQCLASAMTTDDPDKHAGEIRIALRMLDSAGLSLKPTR